MSMIKYLRKPVLGLLATIILGLPIASCSRSPEDEVKLRISNDASLPNFRRAKIGAIEIITTSEDGTLLDFNGDGIADRLFRFSYEVERQDFSSGGKGDFSQKQFGYKESSTGKIKYMTSGEIYDRHLVDLKNIPTNYMLENRIKSKLENDKVEMVK